MKQTEMVVAHLTARHSAFQPDIIPILTEGDWSPEDGEKRLDPDKGGKGLFISTIENRLLAGDIDIAVHSLKDVPSDLPDGAQLTHFLPGADDRDAFISQKAADLDSLPPGCVIGTASLRRQALIKTYWPNLEVSVIRGNVPTRLEKLENGQVDALILAAAGLERLDLTDRITRYLDPAQFVPCGGQGIIGIEIVSANTELSHFLDPLCCHQTALKAQFERGFLGALGGSCHTPVGINARFDPAGQSWQAFAYLGDPNGQYHYTMDRSFSFAQAEDAAREGEVFAAEFIRDVHPSHIAELGLLSGSSK